MPETLEKPKDLPIQDIASYSPEQLQFMIENGLIDPSQVPSEIAQRGAAPFASSESSGFSHTSEGQELSLGGKLEEAEREAIDGATSLSEAGDQVSSVAALEAAEKSEKVRVARSNIKDVFGTQAKAVEAEATEAAIKRSRLEVADPTDLVEAVASNKASKPALKERSLRKEVGIDDGTATSDEQFARLVDKVNGKAAPMLDKQARKDQSAIKELGLSGQPANNLKRKIVGSKGANLSKTDAQINVTDEMIGDALLGATTDGKPKISSPKLREALKDIAKNPGDLRLLAEAAARRRHGGKISAETKRRIGVNLRRHSNV